MASFAKLNSDNVVLKVESVANAVLQDANGIEQESIGVQFLKNLYKDQNSNWKQTSYNTIAGIHRSGGTPFRKNHANIGYTYDEDRDAFIPPKPFNSWILNETTCQWEAPVVRPTLTQEQIDNNNFYVWNEEQQNWDLIEP